MARSIARDGSKVPTEVREVIRPTLLGEKPWPMVLFGKSGVGKTCIALCIADVAAPVVKYFTMEDLVDELNEVHAGRVDDANGNKISSARWFEKAGEANLVVIDDIGTRAAVGDRHYNSLKRILDVREGRPTIVISNLPLHSLQEIYDDRVVSRLAAGTVIEIKGQDRRLG